MSPSTCSAPSSARKRMSPRRRSEWLPALRRLAAPVLLAAAAALGGCGDRAADGATKATAAPAAPAAAPGEATLKLGRDVYNYRCYFCHGYSGDAKTLATSYLDPKPRDFQTTKPEEMPVERILAAVKHGKPG